MIGGLKGDKTKGINLSLTSDAEKRRGSKCQKSDPRLEERNVLSGRSL